MAFPRLSSEEFFDARGGSILDVDKNETATPSDKNAKPSETLTAKSVQKRLEASDYEKLAKGPESSIEVPATAGQASAKSFGNQTSERKFSQENKLPKKYQVKSEATLKLTTCQWIGSKMTRVVKVAVAFLLLYSCIGGLFAICLTVFLSTLSSVTPTYYAEHSLTRGNPGASIRPVWDLQTDELLLDSSEPASYEMFVLDLEHVRSYYADLETRTARTQCSEEESSSSACTFAHETVMRDRCSFLNKYGYASGEPCILLRMNKIYSFVPQPYSSREELMTDNGLSEEDARFLSFSEDSVGVNCDGVNADDKSKIHNITYQTEEEGGIPIKHWPFTNQLAYKPPFMFVVFNNVTRGVLIQVSCQLYAKNIYIRTAYQKEFGAVTFEIQIQEVQST